MNATIQSLSEQLAAREADLAAVVRGKPDQTFDLIARRWLRQQQEDVEADIRELRAEIERQEAWEASPVRLERLAEAKAATAKAEKELAEAEKGWSALERWLADGARIAADIAGRHAAAGGHLAAAVKARFPEQQHFRQRENVLSNLLPVVRGDSSGLARVVASGIRSALADLPCAGKVFSDYLAPNDLGGTATLSATVDAARASCATRLADLTKDDVS